MPDTPFLTLSLEDETASETFGQRLAGALAPGDTIALNGPLGAGKSTIARAAIRTLMGRDVDVPSPTFTLVQTYDGPSAEIWHVDLYRIEDEGELDALGLEDAFGDAIVLIEWPDRLGHRLPVTSLTIDMEPTESKGRRIGLTGGINWADRLGAAFA